jgi:hypothetical protein
MTRSNSDEDGYILIDEDKLKEDQKAEVQEAIERFRRECLKSFSAMRSGEVFKKFDFPTLQPLTEAQRENKMLDAVHQAVNHAFINYAPVMTHTMHNAVVKMLGERAFKGYKGPCYVQPNQMGFIPMGSTMDPLAFGIGQRRSESVSEPIQMSTTGVTLPSTSPATTTTNSPAPVYSTTPPLTSTLGEVPFPIGCVTLR